MFTAFIKFSSLQEIRPGTPDGNRLLTFILSITVQIVKEFFVEDYNFLLTLGFRDDILYSDRENDYSFLHFFTWRVPTMTLSNDFLTCRFDDAGKLLSVSHGALRLPFDGFAFDLGCQGAVRKRPAGI